MGLGTGRVLSSSSVRVAGGEEKNMRNAGTDPALDLTFLGLPRGKPKDWASLLIWISQSEDLLSQCLRVMAFFIGSKF